jgi:hypothetical protein
MSALTLHTGNEHNPGNPFGAVEVNLTPAEVVVVHKRRFGARQEWRARPRAEVWPRVEALLLATGFPSKPVLPPPPAGASLRVFRVSDGDTVEAVMMDVGAADKLPPWKALFALLDALARQTSAGALTFLPEDAAPLLEPPAP